jgi:hypothetical protein
VRATRNGVKRHREASLIATPASSFMKKCAFSVTDEPTHF